MFDMKKKAQNKTGKKEVKHARIECRLTEKQKAKIQKKAKTHGISASQYMVLCAIQDKQNAQKEKLEVYTIVTLAQELVRYVQNRYNAKYDDATLNEKVEELWTKLW